MKKLVFCGSIIMLFASVNTLAGDAAAGKAKSVMCAGCHGADGKATIPMYPNLAGQNATYLEKQMKAFRSGERKDPIMNPLAKQLTDADIANLVAYYSSLK